MKVSDLEAQLAGIGVTEALSKLLRDQPEILETILAGINFYLKEHQRAKTECPDGPSVAAAFHRAMDELIAEARQNMALSCKAGCASCCYIEVHITPDEAELLVRYANYAGIKIDWARLEQQSKVERWRQLDYKARRCVFLGQDNTCQVYQHRPMTCRKYLVRSPAERCNSQKYPGGQVALMSANKAEIMASALFSACGSDTFSKQLMKLKPKETTT